MDFSNLGNEIFGYLPFHSTERPSMYSSSDEVSETWATYAQYLKTDHWMRTRLETLKRCKFRCVVCFKGGRLDVHHRSYDRLGYEDQDDLIALCRSCHGKFHEVLDAL